MQRVWPAVHTSAQQLAFPKEPKHVPFVQGVSRQTVHVPSRTHDESVEAFVHFVSPSTHASAQTQPAFGVAPVQSWFAEQLSDGPQSKLPFFSMHDAKLVADRHSFSLRPLHGAWKLCPHDVPPSDWQ